MYLQKRKELKLRGEKKDPIIITNDNKNIILTKKAITQISDISGHALGYKLGENDIKELIYMIRNLNPSMYLGKGYCEVINNLADRFIESKLNFINEREYDFDPEYIEHQQKEALSSTLNENPYKRTSHRDRIGKENRMCNPFENTKLNEFISYCMDSENRANMFMELKSYLMDFSNVTLPHTIVPFDSRYRLMSNTVENTIKWYLHSADDEGSIGDIRLRDTLKEIILVKICPFWIPVGSDKDGYYDKITMTIHEFSNQGAHFAEHRGSTESDIYPIDHHFEFDISRIDGNRIYLNPVCNTFIPRKPIARVENITVSFRNPFQQVTILNDRGTFSVTPGLVTLFTGTVSHNLSTGDLVYILNFASASTSINTEINKAEGHYITRINDLEFTIPVDTSTIVAPADVTIIFGSKRIFFQLEFISLEH